MKPLRELKFGELVEELRDLLHERAAAAARINRRIQELPYDPVLQEYESAEEDFRQRVERATRLLIKEAFADPWPTKALHRLLALVRKARMVSVAEELKRIFFSGVFRQQPEATKRQTMLLSTLLSLGWKASPAQWREWADEVGADAPDLIFRGLWAHGLEFAVRYLPSLARDEKSSLRITNLFPSILEKESVTVFRTLLADVVGECSEPAREVVLEWFTQRDLPPVPWHPASRRDDLARILSELRELSERFQSLTREAEKLEQQEENLGPEGNQAVA